jgi:hypothetical protein
LVPSGGDAEGFCGTVVITYSAAIGACVMTVQWQQALCFLLAGDVEG